MQYFGQYVTAAALLLEHNFPPISNSEHVTKGESAHGFTVVAVDMEIFAVIGVVWSIIVDTVWVVCLVDAIWFIVVDGVWAILVDAACDADVEGGWVLTEKVRGLPVEEEVGTFVMDPTFPPGKNTNQPLLSLL